MACIDDKGYITKSAELILLAMLTPIPMETAAAECGMPLFRVRGAVRELSRAGLIETTRGLLQTTAKGIKALEGKKNNKSET